MDSKSHTIREMQPNPLTRRRFLKGLLLAGGGALLAACTPAAQPTQAPPTQGSESVQEPTKVAEPAAAGPATLRLSVWADITDLQVYNAILEDFAKVEPDISASAEQYVGGYYDKIQTNFAAGTSADILYFQGWSWQPFADKGQLLAMDDLIAKDGYTGGWPDIENYDDNTLWYGKRYMSVADTGSVVMYYNKDLFDKAGVPYPTDGWTYAEFQQAVEKTTREEGGIKYYGYAQAHGWNGSYLRSLHWMRMDGALEWDRIVEPKKANWLDERIVAALQYTIVDVIAKGLCPTPSAIEGGGVSISTGRVAMTMEGPWILANMWGPQAAVEGGLAFDVVEPPKGTKGTDETVAEVHGHVIAKSSKAPEAAWKLVKYIMSEEGQKRIADGGRMCGTPDNIEKLWVPIAQETYHFANARAFANAMRSGRNPVFAGPGANYDSLAGSSAPLAVAWDAMLAGTSAKEALTVAQPLVQQMLDEYWAKKQQ